MDVQFRKCLMFVAFMERVSLNSPMPIPLQTVETRQALIPFTLTHAQSEWEPREPTLPDRRTASPSLDRQAEGNGGGWRVALRERRVQRWGILTPPTRLEGILGRGEISEKGLPGTVGRSAHSPEHRRGAVS